MAGLVQLPLTRRRITQGWSSTTAAKPATQAPSPNWWRVVRLFAFATSWTPMLVVKKPSSSVPTTPAANRAPRRDVNFAVTPSGTAVIEKMSMIPRVASTLNAGTCSVASDPPHQQAGHAPVENASDHRHNKTETDTHGHGHVAPPWSRYPALSVKRLLGGIEMTLPKGVT